MGILSFISRQSSRNVSVIKLFPVKGKQKNVSLNNFTMQACVKKKISITYIMPKYLRWIVGCTCSIK